MGKTIGGAVMLLVVTLLMFSPTLRGEPIPILNDGKKWRIGYYEGGPYTDYTDTMRTLVECLVDDGWINDDGFPKLTEELPMPYWDWLEKTNSPYLSFSKEDAYSAGWDVQRRKLIVDELMKKLVAKKLDLVIAMGTWAGLDLANNKHSVPVMVLSTSDPLRAGIIKSVKNSGFRHVTARIDPNRYTRQISMFHRIVGFKTMGIAYEDTPEGLIYSAVKDARTVAAERGFELVLCEVLDTTTNTEKADETCRQCFTQLSGSSDAVYVTALTCLDRIETEIAEIFRQERIPSFSMVGSRLVKKGLMLSISSDSGYKQLGKYNAGKFGEILNGREPVLLNMVFEDPLDIAVNMKTIKHVGFNMPQSIIGVATEIYE